MLVSCMGSLVMMLFQDFLRSQSTIHHLKILDFIPFIHSLWCPAPTLQNICVAHTLYSHSQLGSTSGTKTFLDIVEEVHTGCQTSQISRLLELVPISNPS